MVLQWIMGCNLNPKPMVTLLAGGKLAPAGNPVPWLPVSAGFIQGMDRRPAWGCLWGLAKVSGSLLYTEAWLLSFSLFLIFKFKTWKSLLHSDSAVAPNTSNTAFYFDFKTQPFMSSPPIPYAMEWMFVSLQTQMCWTLSCPMWLY